MDCLTEVKPFSSWLPKFEFIVKEAQKTALNHLSNIAELGGQKWQDEQEQVLWTPPVKTYWLMYIDLVSENLLGDLKNKFGYKNTIFLLRYYDRY